MGALELGWMAPESGAFTTRLRYPGASRFAQDLPIRKGLYRLITKLQPIAP